MYCKSHIGLLIKHKSEYNPLCVFPWNSTNYFIINLGIYMYTYYVSGIVGGYKMIKEERISG